MSTTITTTEHTAGPWVVQALETNHHGYDWPTFCVRNKPGNHCLAVVGVVDRATADQNTANARLIATAPELLELCRTVLIRLDVEHAERIAKGETTPHFICAALRNDLRAAIAKATGGAQ